MNTWRAGCGGTGTSGSEGGPEKRTSRKTSAGRSGPTPHRAPDREGKVYCCVVLDVFSRKVVGWSIDRRCESALVNDALTWRATPGRRPRIGHPLGPRQPVHLLGLQRDRPQQDLVSSMGTIGDCYDNAPMESFWGSMQIELLNRKKWRTNIELAIAMAEWIENFYNPSAAQLARLPPPDRVRSPTPSTISTHPDLTLTNGGPENGDKVNEADGGGISLDQPSVPIHEKWGGDRSAGYPRGAQGRSGDRLFLTTADHSSPTSDSQISLPRTSRVLTCVRSRKRRHDRPPPDRVFPALQSLPLAPP